ncbi:hypothetical protein CY34DRAFT_808514 [Suillus luteus UH-Slu-Lm8-n1]|uniref:Uncharacterized protein n=1 Tax=Suillus luteus UH-Slu-Lm8-n1 TaxID=930992 RepID=A0A0D0AME0_9AGAM|nr:hypothetical protein P692DRAFT_20714716 [Suillus brevipes Sb2]KIK39264.1 hypothetical protein CY34DRAFT_808514 [Suillus luteus UH-Slu-Lm8-n1]
MVKDYLWRQRVKFESTLALSMLEPWEKILCLIIFSLLTMLVMIGLFQYLPQHVMVMQRRAIYYLWGQEGDVFRSWVENPGLKEL